jgi:hypothetical protein
MDLREIGCDDVDWINLAQKMDQPRTLVNFVINLRLFFSCSGRMADSYTLKQFSCLPVVACLNSEI